jgi:hypothetical protein
MRRDSDMSRYRSGAASDDTVDGKLFVADEHWAQAELYAKILRPLTFHICSRTRVCILEDVMCIRACLLRCLFPGHVFRSVLRLKFTHARDLKLS